MNRNALERLSDVLERLSKEDLIALVLLQAQQIEALMKRVAELEAKLGQPPKTPDNSSTPPSRGAKPNRPEKPKKPRQGRPGTFRTLALNPTAPSTPSPRPARIAGKR